MTRLTISESQANADALARRGLPHAGEHHASVTVAWDYRKREPRNLREAVRAVRKAYADETPERLHEHAIGDDGTPRMTHRAEQVIFGNPMADDAGRDAETGERDLTGYYVTPFRAALERFKRGDESRQRQGRMVSHVTIGGLDPYEAALVEGAHPLDANLSIENAIRCFLRTMSDLRVHAPHLQPESQTAA